MSGEIDSRTIERGGIRYRVDLDPDYDVTPDEYGDDAYRQEAKDAYARYEWRFVGVTVTPLLDRINQEWSSASVWGVEYGDLPVWNADGTSRVVHIDLDSIIAQDDYIVPDLISECRILLAKLRDKLNALDLGES